MHTLAADAELTSRFEDLARPLGAIGERQRHDLVVLGEFDLFAFAVSF
jgi:hypothetical protein